ncbi:MAG: hypothetical protein CMJ31_12045 [Phycisphaerae bacterium]|nr:hypothetical protein [Phycisphaerae bacterium]
MTDHRATPRRLGVTSLVFVLASFVSAALLFVVQPMAAKRLLPLLGGSPAVWTTCMLFFQVSLLAGYSLAHAIGGRRRRRWLVVYIVALLVGATVSLAFLTGSGIPRAGVGPIVWLLADLFATIGVAFVSLAAAGPLIQRWFDRAGGGNPYFLFAAGNAGSLIGLLGYPALVEPAVILGSQRLGWIVGLILATVLLAICGVAAARGVEPGPDEPDRDEPSVATAAAWQERAGWIGFAFVPSSLMLGATSFITTDVAAFPLLWVVPLSIYLVTFILVFSGSAPSIALTSRVTAVLLIGAVATIVLQAKHPLGLILAIHLATLFAAAMLCHGRLADSKPPPARLTEFYLCLSIGGALGGVFNAIVAPAVFDAISEYPIALAAVGLAVARTGKARGRCWWGWPLGLFVAIVILGRIDLGDWRSVLLVAAPLVVTFAASRHPIAFAACLAVTLFTTPRVEGSATLLHAERTFFGIHRVERVDRPGVTPHLRLMHGSTVHGVSLIDRPGHPTSYYHPMGPIGDVFEGMTAGLASARVCVVGLGVGSLAYYARQTDAHTYVEIDPEVVRIARTSEWFPFLATAKGDVNVVVGDGRLVLDQAPPESFDLIVIDAFSSDAIPVHLITKEAIELYLERLAPGGVLAMHLSNQHLDLPPVVGSIAGEVGASAWIRYDDEQPELASGDLRIGSVWAVLTRPEDGGSKPAGLASWSRLDAGGADRAWTDDRSDVLGVMKWGRP